MDKDKEVSLAVACRDYFGFLPGTGLQEFIKEVRALTLDDKAEIARACASRVTI